MRILFDDQIFVSQRHGGISRCFAEIVAELARRPDVEPVLPFRRVINRHLLEKRELGIEGFLGDRAFPAKRTLLRLLNRPRVWATVRRGDYDVFHPTFYDVDLVAAARGKPTVVTVHDMAPELMPEAFDKPETIHPGKRALCETATAIVAVSQTTKRDLIRLYGVDPDRIVVVPHGVAADAVWRPGRPAAALPPHYLPPHYLLMVGRRDGYKNFAGATASLIAVLRQRADLSLLCVGGGPLRTDEREPFEAAGVGGRLVQATLCEDGLAYAYAHAEAFIFPSLYEGFGLPILEAFANACPAVLSARSCFPEVAGDAALFFDPDRPETLEAELLRLLGDTELRAHLVAAGRERVQAFTWTAAADRLAALYRRLVD